MTRNKVLNNVWVTFFYELDELHCRVEQHNYCDDERYEPSENSGHSGLAFYIERGQLLGKDVLAFEHVIDAPCRPFSA